MPRDEFERITLADVRARLLDRPFLTAVVRVEETGIERDGDRSQLVVLFTVERGGTADRFGWRAPVWPAPDIPPELHAQLLVSHLVEKVESADAVLDGTVDDGVRWMS